MRGISSRLRLAASCLALAAGLVTGGSASVGSAAPSAKLEFKLPKTTTLGEPVIMTVTLFNTTGYRIMVDFGVEDQTEFVFRHTRPDGTLVKAEPAIAPINRMRTSRLMLRDNSRVVQVVLDEWLNLSELGGHRIEVEYQGAVVIEGGNEANVNRTKQLSVEVKPRDARRLEKRAAEWLKQVQTLSPGPDTRAAGAALIAIRDPVAIPYLELAVSRTRGWRFAEALGRMSDPEARAALDRLSRNQDPDVRALAQKAIGSAAYVTRRTAELSSGVPAS